MRVVNHERARHGLRALRPARGLTRVARSHSRDQMRHGALGHAASDGTPFARRLARAGRFRIAGEVVAWAPGHVTARGIVTLWLQSPAHRAQLLNPRYRTFGVGRARGRAGTWVTADLAAG